MSETFCKVCHLDPPCHSTDRHMAHAEIERLRAERAFLLAQIERALCGCVGRDCRTHGAYASDDIERLDAMLRAALSTEGT